MLNIVSHSPALSIHNAREKYAREIFFPARARRPWGGKMHTTYPIRLPRRKYQKLALASFAARNCSIIIGTTLNRSPVMP